MRSPTFGEASDYDRTHGTDPLGGGVQMRLRRYVIAVGLVGGLLAPSTAQAGIYQDFMIQTGNGHGTMSGSVGFDGASKFRVEVDVVDLSCDGKGVKGKFVIDFANGSHGSTEWLNHGEGCAGGDHGVVSYYNFYRRHRKILDVRPRVCLDYGGVSSDCSLGQRIVNNT